MKSVRVVKRDLDGLLDYIKENKLALPEFQRGYVWNEQKIKDLFDSLINKYPIGSFIVWETNKKIEQRPLFYKDIRKSGRKCLLLDGQQRLLTLFYLCKQTQFADVKSEFEEVYDCKQSSEIPRFENYWFDSTKKLPKMEQRGTNGFDYDNFKKRLSDYEFPIIIITINDLDKAKKLFERINQNATKISSEAIFLSEVWNSEMSLGKTLRRWRNDRRSRKKLVGNLGTSVFIHAFALIFQLENREKYGKLEINVKRLKKIAEEIIATSKKERKGYRGMFDRSLRAVERAMDFILEHYSDGIKKIHDLPSQTLIPVLSVYFYYKDYYKETDPTRRQARELKKWFWASSLTNRYTGRGYHDYFVEDAERIAEFAENKRAKIILQNAVELDHAGLTYEKMLELGMNTGRSSTVNAIKLMLWLSHPIGLDGNKLELDSSGSGKLQKQDDHFYPHDLSKDKKGRKSGEGIDEEKINSILNLSLLKCKENIKKLHFLPSVWLEKEKEEKGFRKMDERSFFESHLLPFDSVRELKEIENKFVDGDGTSIKNWRRFKEEYDNFLTKRFKRFKERLYELQCGE